MEFLQNLTEARLLGGGKTGLKKYNARDVADLLFLHICALQMMKHEFYGLPEAQKYIKNSGNLIHFDYWSSHRNELYVLIHVLIGRFAEPQQRLLKDQEASRVFIERVKIDKQLLRKYLRLIAAGKTDESFERRFLLGLEHGLMISNSNYRAIRRLVMTWPKQSHSTKQLVMTRLLQILRSKARRSELLPILEAISRKQKMEDRTLKPLEGEDNRKAQKTPTKPKMGFIKSLALGAAAGVAGGLAGYHLTRRKKSS